MLCLFLVLASAIVIDHSGLILIPTDTTEVTYELTPAAVGAIFNLCDGVRLLSFAAQTSRVAFTLRFDDDDYHNSEVLLSFTNVDVAFDSLGPIDFSIGRLTAFNTRFLASKSMNVTYTGQTTSEMDLFSLVSGFAKDSIFSKFLTATHSPLLLVPAPSTLDRITFYDTEFALILATDVVHRFSDLRGFRLAFTFPDDSQVLCTAASGSSAQIQGGLALFGRGLRVLFDDSFERIRRSSLHICLFCEIVHVPFSTLPYDFFLFVNENWEPRADQVVLYSGWMSYCVYDGPVPCKVHGTYPLQATSFVEIEAGVSVSYVLETSAPVTVVFGEESANSLTFIGGSQKRMTLEMSGSSHPTGNLSFDGLDTVTFAGQNALVLTCASFALKSPISLARQNLDRFAITVSQSFNCSLDFYTDNIANHRVIDQLRIGDGGALAVYGVGTFTSLDLAEQSAKITRDSTSLATFDRDLSSNRLVIYTTALDFRIVAHSDRVRGGVAVWLSTASNSSPATIEAEGDWSLGSLGPIQFIAPGIGHVFRHEFSSAITDIVDVDPASFAVYDLRDAPICLYYASGNPCDPGIDGIAIGIPRNEYTIPSGRHHIFTLPPDFDQSTTILFDRDSVRDIGFAAHTPTQLRLQLHNNAQAISSLFLENVNLEIDVDSELTLASYTNLGGSLRARGQTHVTQNLVLSWPAAIDFFCQDQIRFSGDTILIQAHDHRPSDSDLATIVAATHGWDVSGQQSSFHVPVVSNFTIQSYSSKIDLSFSPNDQDTIPPLTITAFQTSWITFADAYRTAPQNKFHSPTVINSASLHPVYVVHPFPYYDANARLVFSIDPARITTYSDRNASMCLSYDGASDCGLSGFVIRKAYPFDPMGFLIPPGDQYFIYVNVPNAVLVISDQSPHILGITSFGMPVGLVWQMPSPTLQLTLRSAQVMLDSFGPLYVTLQTLSLVDVTMFSMADCSMTVTGDANIEMAAFANLTNGEGVFRGDRLQVHGTLFLRDSPAEYLEQIQFSPTGCVLRVNIGSVSTEIPVPRDHFYQISLGTNTVDETVPRFIPLTVSSPNAIIAGDVTVRIEAVNEYLVIGPEWANVLLSDSTIVIAASLNGTENGRVIYDSSVDVARCFAISEHIALLENSSAPVGLWSRGSASSYYSLSRAPLDLIPMECANELCVIRDSRRYIVFPDDVRFSFAVDGINPSLLFPSSMTLNMDNIPIGASFALGPAFGWTSPVYIEFKNTQKRLGNLTISDPIRLTFPNPFSLIVDRLAVDFRSFKRFFRDVGVFANGDVLHVNREFVLTEGHYYTEVMLTHSGWQLIGNEDAWNTTFDLGQITLGLETDTENFRISATGTTLREGFSLKMTGSPASVVIDPSILSIADSGQQRIFVDATVSAYCEHSFVHIPPFFQVSERVELVYRPLSNTIRQCVYRSSASECRLSYDTAFSAADEFALPAAATAILELQADARAMLLNTSAAAISIIGNNHNLALLYRAGAEASQAMGMALSNVVITFEGEPTVFLKSLSTDYQSLSSAYATFQIAEALTIGGDAPDPGQLGNPRFILGSGTQFSITNTHFLPQAEMLDTFVISLGNGQTQWHISGLVVGDRFVYGQGTAILANTAGPTDTELSFPMPDSALIVTKGWDADRVLPMISTGANPLNLTLLQPADFFYGAGSHVLVSPTTFSKMSFNSLYQTQLTIGTTVGISEIVVADTVLYVYLVNISYPIIIDRRAFTGPMRFVHDDLYNGLPLRIGSCERVPENLILELRPHSVLILDPGWTTVRDTIHVTLSGSHATVYYQGEVEPAVFDVVGTEIRFLPWNEPPAADSNSVSSGTVVGIIVAVLLVIPAGTGLYLLFRRRFVAVLADDYDKFTDLPSEQGAVLRDL